MRTMNEKALSYLKGNPKVAEFITKVNEERKILLKKARERQREGKKKNQKYY